MILGLAEPSLPTIGLRSCILDGILNVFMKFSIISKVALGLSSWIKCPTLFNTHNLNFPCICAIVSSLSILSEPASKRILGTFTLRKH